MFLQSFFKMGANAYILPKPALQLFWQSRDTQY